MNIKKSQYCYLCNKAKNIPKFTKLGFIVQCCPNCRFLSLEFKQNYEKFLKEYYQEGYFVKSDKIHAYSDYFKDKPNIIKNGEIIIRLINKYKQKGNLLDIGCAMGFFMELAVQKGFYSYGIEVSEYAYKYAHKNFNNNVYLGSAESFFQNNICHKFNNHLFDVVTFLDLIEHFKDPRNILANVNKILKDDGIILIQTGDSESVWAKMMGKNWHFFAPPQHLYFFSERTLGILLEQAGYEVISIHKIGKYLSLPYIIQMSRYMNVKLINDLLYPVIEKTPLKNIDIPIKLFDNMVAIARKRV